MTQKMTSRGKKKDGENEQMSHLSGPILFHVSVSDSSDQLLAK